MVTAKLLASQPFALQPFRQALL